MLQNYLKIALRNLRTQRHYTLLNIIGLSVGIACGLFIFLFLRHHLSTDRHHANYDRIFRIDTDLHLDDGSIEYNPEAPLPMAQVLRTDYPQVEQAAFLMMIRELTVGVKRENQPEPLRFREHNRIGFVEPEWFDILSYRWLQGNAKTALNQPNSIVLTESYARKYVGDSNPLGQIITLDNKINATVTGVLADPPATDTDLGVFISLATLKQYDPKYDQTDWGYLNSTNRLYLTLKDPNAVARLEQTFSALAKKHYGAYAKVYRFHAQPMHEFHFDVARGGGAIRSSLLWSLGVIGALLIGAACINFVNLATAQALRRGKEVGIRKTLGSSRRQLIGQFFLETSIIIVVAASLALLWVLLLLPLFTDWVQVPLSPRFNGPTLAFVGLLLLTVVLLAGGYPAVVLSGVSPWAALRGRFTATGSTRGVTVRRVLVVTQFVVCQGLIIGALVVAKQTQYIQQADLGFRKDNVLLVNLPDQKASTQEAFRQRLSQYPDIQSVSFSHRPPASALQYGGSFKFNGKPDWEPYPIRDRLADANYLQTYGLSLVAGRNIAPSDTIREYLINETLLHQLGFRDPQQVVGKTMQYYLSPVALPIVGVVRDFHQKSLREPIGPCLIASYANRYAQAGIRVSGQNPVQTLQHIRETWQHLYPNEVFEHEYLDETVARFYETELLVARLINVFTTVAILICCLGLYGLVSHTVVQRTKEIGIRKVLGASVSSIAFLLTNDFLKLVLIALIIASPLAWYAMHRWLQDFAYRIDISWWVFALAGLLAIGIAVLTVSFQSIKAALTNPVNALRSE